MKKYTHRISEIEMLALGRDGYIRSLMPCSASRNMAKMLRGVMRSAHAACMKYILPSQVKSFPTPDLGAVYIALSLAFVAFLSACTAPVQEQSSSVSGVKLGKPYEIDGRVYSPTYNPYYDETGVASWYGPGFHGGRTASGERYDQNELTA